MEKEIRAALEAAKMHQQSAAAHRQAGNLSQAVGCLESALKSLWQAFTLGGDIEPPTGNQTPPPVPQGAAYGQPNTPPVPQGAA